MYQPYVSAGLNAGLSAIALVLTFALSVSALAGGALLHRVEHRRILWLSIGVVGFAAAAALTQAATLSSFYGEALRFRGPAWPLLLAGACLLVLGAVSLTAVLSERLRALSLSLCALSATFCVSVSGAMILYAVNGDRAPALRSPLLLSGALALGVVAGALSLRIVHQLREQRGSWLTPSRRLLPACVIGAAIIALQYVALGALHLRDPQFNAHITARGELVLLVGAVMLLAVAAALAQSYVDRAQADRLADLTRVAYVLQALSADPNPLQRLVDAAVELGGAHRAGVLVEDGAGSLKLLALSAGAEGPGDWEAIRVPLKDVGAFTGGRRAFIPDFQATECSPALREYVGPRAVLCEPIRSGEKVAGMLAVVFQTRRHRPSPELAGLSELLAASGGWTIERGETLERLHDSTVLETRTRVACDLHDSVSQDIAAALTYTNLARSAFGLARSAPTTERLSELAGFLDESEKQLRSTQRDMSGLGQALRSRTGDTQGGVLLSVAMAEAAAAFQHQMPGVAFTFSHAGGEREIAPEVAGPVALLLREALHNIVKHARPSSVSVFLHVGEDQLTVAVKDDGAGFRQGEVPSGHLGLLGMHERAERLQGALEVISAPGQGTSIVLNVPLRRSREGTEAPILAL